MIRQAAAIARASVRILVNHVVIAVGGTTRALLVLAGVVATGAAGNVMVYAYFSENLAPVFDPAARLGAAAESARDALVQGNALTGATISLLLLIFAPAQSNLSVSARIAGASRRAVALGQFVPLLLGICAVVLLSGLGATLFLASTGPHPIAAAVGLAALGVAYAAGALVAHHAVLAAARNCGLPTAAARMLGLTAGFGLVGWMFADMLSSTLHARTSLAARIAHLLWGGAPIPPAVPAAAWTALIAAVLLGVLLTVSTVFEQVDPVMGARLVSVPPIGRPRHLGNFVAREAALALRHPVTQLSLLMALLFAALLVAGVRAGYVPVPIAVEGLALLMSAGVEAAYGRTREWNWIYRIAGYSSVRRVLAQFAGSSIPGAALFAAAITAMTAATRPSLMDVLDAATALIALSAAAYLGGVILPYNPTAPAGMLLTSVVGIGLEGAALWGASRLATFGPVIASAFELAVAAAALAAACVLAAARSGSSGSDDARSVLTDAVASVDATGVAECTGVVTMRHGKHDASQEPGRSE